MRFQHLNVFPSLKFRQFFWELIYLIERKHCLKFKNFFSFTSIDYYSSIQVTFIQHLLQVKYFSILIKSFSPHNNQYKTATISLFCREKTEPRNSESVHDCTARKQKSEDSKTGTCVWNLCSSPLQYNASQIKQNVENELIFIKLILHMHLFNHQPSILPDSSVYINKEKCLE